MTNTLIYKGFHGNVCFSPDDQCLFGEIIGITDTITYTAESAADIRKQFEEAVDYYIEVCKDIGKKPLKSYSGSLNVRIGQEMHLKAAIKAQTEGISLNKFIKKALEKEVDKLSLPPEKSLE
ncbi:MAG: type II toxin-antitoxin system HicB family antitoxin [Candidatus Marinimicrobia bacterium]|nr:type II toxin-antitoxin system HicB family antitoxin [Candidatus Neomarinimicrobiota bacterium]